MTNEKTPDSAASALSAGLERLATDCGGKLIPGTSETEGFSFGMRDLARFAAAIERRESCRIESLEVALRQLLAAAMPVRADGATLQEVARAIPELYDACHSAAIVLRSNNRIDGACKDALPDHP